MSADKIEQMSRYLSAADGVIVLIDPLQFAKVRKRVDQALPMPERLAGDERPVPASDRITQLLLASSPVSGLVEKPVAFVVSKLDMIRDLLPTGSALRRDQPQRPYFDTEDGAEVNEQVHGLLRDLGGGEISRVIGEYYQTAACFAVSALGDPPQGTSVGPGGVHPYRVADPFLWLLSNFGLIQRQ